MKHIKIFGLALVAVLVLSAAAVSSASAALEFESSSNGSLLGKNVGNHKFKTSAGTVECSTATASGSITSAKTAVQAVKVEYSGCKFSIFGATVSPAEYLFNAAGTATLDNTVTIVAAGFCTATVAPQGPLSKVLYKNIAGPPMELEVVAEVTGIHYVLGSGCPGAGLHTDGTYNGTEIVKNDSGNILVN